ncbi:GtrA family protein [Paenibacillus sp. MER 99-2]|uniref:GtrA family protein n=1 Tax=Paenibacillus sp. MER 99-2 TaxID=2939572 RepID=UPI00203E511D|nr:GtrA family protein [Paenibacillus sp. MER 99-2]MCM3172446.1 GtrA family protein [Paenibacillus sp. MER 99-2]
MIKRFTTIIKFGIVGILNTGVDAVVFAVLAFVGVPAMVAQAISYSCGIVNSYWWNNRWTFRDVKSQAQHKRIVRFLIANLFVLILSSLIIYVAHSLWSWSLVSSKAAATLLGMLINYLISRYWVFRSSSEAANDVSIGTNERREHSYEN